MTGSILQWLGAIGGLAGVIVAIVSIPKSRGEGHQAEKAGSKFEAEGQVALSAEWRAERDNILRTSREAREAAEATSRECRAENARMRSTIEAMADAFEPLIPMLPPGEAQRKARVAVTAARMVL